MEKGKIVDSVKKLTFKEKMIMTAAAGIVLLLLCLPSDSDSSKTESADLNETAASSGTLDYLKEYSGYLEKRLVSILSESEGIGDMDVMITLESSEEYVDDSKIIMPKVSGVVILCDGGESAAIKEEITKAVQALFSIESNKIRILKKQ